MNRHGLPAPIFLLFVCVAAASSSRAATVWSETGATVNTVVADVATAAPADPLAPLPAPVPFKGFRYPHVDDAEDVTFIADDPGYVSNGAHHGILRSFAADGHLQTLVSKHDRIPGTDREFEWLRGMQSDERGNDFVFNATGQQGKERGLYLWSAGKITTIARTGVTVLPGESAPLSEVYWGSLRTGRILYVAQDGEQRFTLVLHDVKTGAVRVLARGGDPIAGHPGKTFHELAHQNWMSDDSVVFRASSDAPAKADDITTGRTGLYGWLNVRWDDPATLDPTRLVTLADTDTALPGQSGNFTDFFSAPAKGDVVTFQGGGPKGRGIYFSKAGGAVQPIVDRSTEMPGLFRGKFTSFGIWPTMVNNEVIFTANAAGFHGVFLYRLDQDTIYLLADNRAELEGKTIGWFELGARPMVGHRFAVTIHFQNGDSGVYLATIPAHAFKRHDAAGDK